MSILEEIPVFLVIYGVIKIIVIQIPVLLYTGIQALIGVRDTVLHLKPVHVIHNVLVILKLEQTLVHVILIVLVILMGVRVRGIVLVILYVDVIKIHVTVRVNVLV